MRQQGIAVDEHRKAYVNIEDWRNRPLQGGWANVIQPES